MAKPFKLQFVKRFRRLPRVKTCGNCKHLITEDYGGTLRCKRPNRIRGRQPQPYWTHHSGNYADQVFAEIWQHVCDRWTKKGS